MKMLVIFHARRYRWKDLMRERRCTLRNDKSEYLIFFDNSFLNICTVENLLSFLIALFMFHRIQRFWLKGRRQRAKGRSFLVYLYENLYNVQPLGKSKHLREAPKDENISVLLLFHWQVITQKFNRGQRYHIASIYKK